MEKIKTIYDLELHATLSIDEWTSVTRVHGGFMYIVVVGLGVSTIFTPCSDQEFNNFRI